MQYLKQSTASQAVLIGPFVDDTDGVTAETGLTINASDIRLSANGGNMAAKNSGGGTHDENGWYAITLDATDTATVGRLQVSCKVAGALPVFAEFQVLEEAVYDALFASSATGLLPSNVTQFLGTAITESTTGDIADRFSADTVGQRFNLNFEEVSGYVQIPVISQFSRVEDWNFTCWFKQRSTPDNDLQTLIEHSKTTGNRLAIRHATGGEGGCIEVAMYNGSSYGVWQTDYDGFNDNRWHLVSVAWDGTAQEPAAIYVDGYSVPFSTASGGAIGTAAKYIGYKSQATAYTSEHHQADTRIYTRNLSAGENLLLWENRFSKLVVNDPLYWLHPKSVNSSSIPNIGTGSDADASFVSYERGIYEPVVDTVDEPMSIYTIGNSLTEDAESSSILTHGSKCINSGETLAYHYANPGTFETGSIPWNVALATREYDVIMFQPYQDDPLQALDDDLTPIRAWMALQPKAIVLIYTGFPVSSVWSGGATPVDDAYTGNFAYSAAYFDAMVEQLELEYPERTIIRTKSLECVELAVSRIQAGTSALATVNGTVNQNDALYRDGIHMNYFHGRYLMANSVRRALGLPNSKEFECMRGFITYDTFDGIQPDFKAEMDTVLDQIYGPATDSMTIDEIYEDTNSTIPAAQVALSSAVTQVDTVVDAILAGQGVSVDATSPFTNGDNLSAFTNDTTTYAFTVSVDYTSGWNATLIIQKGDDETAVFDRISCTIASATSITAEFDYSTWTTTPTFTTGCNSKVATLKWFLVVTTAPGGDDTTIASGGFYLHARGTTSA